MQCQVLMTDKLQKLNIQLLKSYTLFYFSACAAFLNILDKKEQSLKQMAGRKEDFSVIAK